MFAQKVELSRQAIGVAGGQMTTKSANGQPSLKVWHIAGQSSPINLLSGINHELRQGFQQPLGRVLKSAVPVKITAFPNPSEGLFQLTIQDEIVKPITMKCYTLNGNIAFEMIIKTSTTPIDLQHLPVGLYTIKLFAGRKNYETLKIFLK